MSLAVLALVMSVLVLVVAAVALRDGLRDGSVKPATAAPVSRRARSRPALDRSPVRAGLTLLASSAGIGLLLALGVGLIALVLGLALRTAVDG